MKVYELGDETIIRFKKSRINFESVGALAELKKDGGNGTGGILIMDMINIRVIDGTFMYALYDLVANNRYYKDVEFVNVTEPVKKRFLEMEGLYNFDGQMHGVSKESAEIIFQKVISSTVRDLSAMYNSADSTQQPTNTKQSATEALNWYGYLDKDGAGNND